MDRGAWRAAIHGVPLSHSSASLLVLREPVYGGGLKNIRESLLSVSGQALGLLTTRVQGGNTPGLPLQPWQVMGLHMKGLGPVPCVRQDFISA